MSTLGMMTFAAIVAILGLTMLAEMAMCQVSKIIIMWFHSRKG